MYLAITCFIVGLILGWKTGAEVEKEKGVQAEQRRTEIARAIEEEKRRVRAELREEAKARRQGNLAAVR